MSATLDIETQIYSAIFDSVLLADADWKNLFGTGNVIRHDQIQGIQTTGKQTVADGDYPQAELWLRNGQSDMWEGSPTFATYSDTPPADWLENHNYTYRLELISDLQNVGEPDQLGAQSRAAFRKAGMRLGTLTYVKGIKLSWETRKIEVEQEGKMRWKTTMDIAVKVIIDGANLQ